MKMINGFMAIAFILSSQAMANPEIGNKKTCTAQYGEGYSWLVVNIEEKEVCYRCTEGYPQTVITSSVSVPYGPRGTYITQKYSLTNTSYFRNGTKLGFQKSGQPSGPTSGNWNQWFPQNIDVLVTYYSGEPLKINFKGQNLDLDCK
jgi:hypothetical protein